MSASPIIETLQRLSLAQGELVELLHLVHVNENPGRLPVYSLVEKIAGTRVRYRLENLLVHLWSAKDFYELEVDRVHGPKARAEFSAAVHKPRNSQLVQYMANRIKHGAVTRLPRNPFVLVAPYIGTPYLRLWNHSFPGRFKPFIEVQGDEIPPFEMHGPAAGGPDGTTLGFDSARVSAPIVGRDGSAVGDAYVVCEEFAALLRRAHSGMDGH